MTLFAPFRSPVTAGALILSGTILHSTGGGAWNHDDPPGHLGKWKRGYLRRGRERHHPSRAVTAGAGANERRGEAREGPPRRVPLRYGARSCSDETRSSCHTRGERRKASHEEGGRPARPSLCAALVTLQRTSSDVLSPRLHDSFSTAFTERKKRTSCSTQHGGPFGMSSHASSAGVHDSETFARSRLTQHRVRGPEFHRLARRANGQRGHELHGVVSA